MIKIKGKKMNVILTFYDTNVAKELFSINNPNPLLIPKLNEEIEITMFNDGDEKFTGDGDFTVKSIKKDYVFNKESKSYYMTIWVEVI